jgi:hypothetical protein
MDILPYPEDRDVDKLKGDAANNGKHIYGKQRKALIFPHNL